jgi:hypothetical protein
MNTAAQLIFRSIVVASATICTAASAQEAFQTRIQELSGKTYTLAETGCRTCRGDQVKVAGIGAQDYIDRLSSGDRFVVQNVQSAAIASHAHLAPTAFLAQSTQESRVSTNGNPAQDYINRFSEGDVYHLESETRD